MMNYEISTEHYKDCFAFARNYRLFRYRVYYNF